MAKHTKQEPVLLSGGNPQIAKGYGDAPVQAYIAATPGWKRAVCAQIDAMITEELPTVLKAVKWNSPFYGAHEGTWFLSFHGFAKYIKVSFFQGASLKPEPPEPSTQPEVRYVHIFEAGFSDEEQFRSWIRQAIKLPGGKI